MRLSLIFVLVASCGSDAEPGDGPTSDAAPGGGTDATVADAPSDAAAGTDAAPLDPGLCPVGPADGCCPLLERGGHDPDCPSLACATFVRSEAIPLDDPA